MFEVIPPDVWWTGAPIDTHQFVPFDMSQESPTLEVETTYYSGLTYYEIRNSMHSPTYQEYHVPNTWNRAQMQSLDREQMLVPE